MESNKRVEKDLLDKRKTTKNNNHKKEYTKMNERGKDAANSDQSFFLAHFLLSHNTLESYRRQDVTKRQKKMWKKVKGRKRKVKRERKINVRM